MKVPQSIDATAALLASQDYVADRALSTAVFLALRLQRPLFVEGEPGTGKTEIAKVLAAGLDAELIRLQCYEGLDVNAAAYEWNYARQLVEIRLELPRRATRSVSTCTAEFPASRAARRTSRCTRPARAKLAWSTT
jgi:MoxR-like ATPase